MCWVWLVTVGGESGKRKAGRAGIFDFLFLNFFATQISAFKYYCFAFSFRFYRDFFIGLVVCITL